MCNTCPEVACTNCIVRLLGQKYWDDTDGDCQWSCFACRPSELDELRQRMPSELSPTAQTLGDALMANASVTGNVELRGEDFIVFGHSAVLALRSPFFAARLSDRWRGETQRQTIDVGKDLKQESVERVLRFMYTEREDWADMSPVVCKQMMELADMWSLDSLADALVGVVQTHLRGDCDPLEWLAIFNAWAGLEAPRYMACRRFIDEEIGPQQIRKRMRNDPNLVRQIIANFVDPSQ